VPEVTPSPSDPRRVLVVDDDQQLRSMTAEILETIGYAAVTAADGATAVDLFRTEADSIDVVLLDLRLPDSCGLEVLDRLRAILPEVRVLVTSGAIGSEELSSATDRGAAGTLEKPYSRADLAQGLERALG